jgi:hypothetical protein
MATVIEFATTSGLNASAQQVYAVASGWTSWASARVAMVEDSSNPGRYFATVDESVSSFWLVYVSSSAPSYWQFVATVSIPSATSGDSVTIEFPATVSPFTGLNVPTQQVYAAPSGWASSNWTSARVAMVEDGSQPGRYSATVSKNTSTVWLIYVSSSTPSYAGYVATVIIPTASTSSGSEDSGDSSSSDYIFTLTLQSNGKDATYVNQDGSLSTFKAIVHKARSVRNQEEWGFEESTSRDVSFFADDARGRATIYQYSEMRIDGVKYQIDRFERNGGRWRATLKRVDIQEVARPNRRGRQ